MAINEKPRVVRSHSITLDHDYVDWIQDIKQRFRNSQIKAAVKVNSEQLLFNWQLGRDIVVRKAEEKWGNGIVEQLSLDLRAAFPDAKGFSARNLWFMKQWYTFYSSNSATLTLISDMERLLDTDSIKLNQLGSEIHELKLNQPGTTYWRKLKQRLKKEGNETVTNCHALKMTAKLQKEDGRGYSSVKTIRGVLRPAFQMAVDDDCLQKNPFGFELAGVVVNDSVTREAITKDEMRKFLKFIHDDNVYYKYYDTVYILFHTGMRISEFCGLTVSDIDLENKVINIDHQLQRTSDMQYVIASTKTNAGTRKLPITDDVAECFRRILEEREDYTIEKMVDGYTGFLFLDENGMPLVAMHWEHRFNNMVKRYNNIYRIQIPNITPHVCRHTYCSNMAKAGMNPKTLQYLMGHSDISVTLNTYTHLGLEDAADELLKLEKVRKELDCKEKKEEVPSIREFKIS
ncbi:tyrosine-type recombinase/integrase [Butyrivibrio sp. AD3002]|uniref:tyrosine-type recombinase/integrase n=1 Tax=Butyrivibrio sp. AD3002 TaxID=1280670 RepID=UPI0003B52A17|nr:tyrosine-type recombinase/integrase [Butyrivibrio sp. AD3002]